MKRAVTLLALAALVLGTAPAISQPKPRPAASASAAAPSATAAPSASAAALPAGHPPVGEGLPAGHPAVGEGMPAGHPAVGEGLPAGHPQVAGGGDDDEEQPARGRMDQRMFSPPEDTAVEDASLPAGTIVVTIKDARDQPIPHAPITLGVLHSSVAKGDTHERTVKDADDSGSARFDGLTVGSGHAYRVSTTRGAATFAEPPFGLTARAGKRVTLHSYEASGALDSNMMVVMAGVVAVTLKEDALQVEQLVRVLNVGRVAWLADLPIELPAGFKAFNKQDTMDDTRVEEVPGGVAIRGTFPPGERDLDFRYQVPLEDNATQTLKLRLPDRVRHARVIAEASKTMGLEVSGFPAAVRDESQGQRILATEKTARSPGELSSLSITLTGLPTHGPGRWIAVVLALLALGTGVAYHLQTGSGPIDADARRDLYEAREALLGEIVALTRAHKSGEIGPKTYARVRAALLGALGRIVSMIDAAEPKKKAAPAGGAGPRARRREAST